MHLDERFFHWVWRRSQVFRQEKHQDKPQSLACLAEHRRSLEILLQGLMQRPVPIEGDEGCGGWHGKTLRLPHHLEIFAKADDNAFAYRFRVLQEAALLLLSEQRGLALPGSGASALALLLQTLPPLFQFMDENWPGAAYWRGRMSELCATEGQQQSGPDAELWQLMQKALLAESELLEPLARLELSRKKSKGKAWQSLQVLFANPLISLEFAASIPDCIDLESDHHQRPATEKDGKSAKRPSYAEQDAESNNPVSQVLEKTQTADSYQGNQRSFDDGDDLEDHQEALEEIDFQQVIRTKGRAGSFVNMEHEGSFSAEAITEAEEPQAKVFSYAEWFESKQRYQKNWCTVRERSFTLATPSALMGDPKIRQQAKLLRQQLASLINQSLWCPRQPDGAELDWERVVRRQADVCAGSQADDRVYRDKRAIGQELGCIILVDGSLSTDAWVHGQRVLDQLKTVLATLSLALEGAGFPCEVASFYSQTRQDCRYQLLKEFREPWRHLACRLDSLEPTGYTRIGPALRHSVERLKKCKARHRLILLLSDAKPTDFDAYEGRHGIRDVRKAVLEAERDEIRIRALTVSHSKTRQVFSMFEPGAVHFLGKSENLAEQVFKVFVQLLASKK